jgi:hypothetical protein
MGQVNVMLTHPNGGCCEKFVAPQDAPPELLAAGVQAEDYRTLVNALRDAENHKMEVAKCAIIPWTFVLGPACYMIYVGEAWKPKLAEFNETYAKQGVSAARGAIKVPVSQGYPDTPNNQPNS